MKLLRNLNKYRKFKKESFVETVKELRNPQRGWFRLFTFIIEEEPDFKDEKYRLYGDFNLALVLIDIGAYRDRCLDDEALSRMDRILKVFRANNMDIILRVAYDHEGRGLEREPLTFRQVTEHAGQIARFTAEHCKDIFIYQGLLIGGWGEMHSSRYTAPERLRELYYIFKSELKGKVHMAVRKPVQWRYLNFRNDAEEPIEADGLGIYNDGMFGSDSDLGTYDNSNKSIKDWNSAWSRRNEIVFTGMLANSVPCGGEALYGEGFVAKNTSLNYINELKELKITYLNIKHDIKLIEYWKKQVYPGKGIWDGKSCFQYISAHLGYRYFISNVRALKSGAGCDIRITVKNQGFAPIYGDAKLYLEYEGLGGKRTIEMHGSLKECLSDSEKEYSVIIKPMKGDIYLYARLNGSGEHVLFANERISEDGKLRIGVIR